MPQITFQGRPDYKPPNRMPQKEYIQILFGDLGYDRLHRNDFLSMRLNRSIKFLDDMDDSEMRQMIRELRNLKYGKDETK